MPLGIPILLHLAMVLLSGCALVILVPRIDASSIRERFAGAVLERVAGTMLAGLGILFFFRAFGMLMHGIITQSPLAATDLAVDLADFLITPLWIIGWGSSDPP